MAVLHRFYCRFVNSVDPDDQHSQSYMNIIFCILIKGLYTWLDKEVEVVEGKWM